MRRLIAAALFALAAVAPASATPGQSLDDFDRWARGNVNLHGISGEAGLDGAILYTTSFKAGMTTARFRATSDTGQTHVVRESIVYAGPDDFRLDQHRETAARLLSAVYGSAIADDFRSAPVTTTGYGDEPTVAYRGKLFGYEITGERVTTRLPADFDLDLVCIEADNCPVGD
jgi:hypothetical protein